MFINRKKLNKIFPILQRNISWIILSIMFFTTGFVLAFVFFDQQSNLFASLGEEQFQVLNELGEIVFGSTPLLGIAVLFLNNFISIMNMLIFGVILGIAPLIGLLANGSLLGVVSTIIMQEQTNPLAFLVLGILPHGIFELPAVFISAALALKLGFHIVFPLPQKKRGESFKYIWRNEIFTILPLIFLLLLVGAFIEVLITPYILSFAL